MRNAHICLHKMQNRVCVVFLNFKYTDKLRELYVSTLYRKMDQFFLNSGEKSNFDTTTINR